VFDGASRNHTLATLRATRYCWPSFSSSAMTHCVTQGMHSAYRQSIMPCTKSICSRVYKELSAHIAADIRRTQACPHTCSNARRADVRASSNSAVLLQEAAAGAAPCF
jgi:hypothetical protein